MYREKLAGRSLRRCASSGTNCGPPPPPGCGPRRPFGRKFKIQDSKFRIKQVYRTHLNILPVRGAACGGAQVRVRIAGLRRPQATARRSLRDRFCCGPLGPDGPAPTASPQPSGWACDVEEQPSARGRLRAAGRCATDHRKKTRPYSISRRLSIAWVMVSSSTYSSSSPKPMPRAIEVIFTPAKARSRLIR